MQKALQEEERAHDTSVTCSMGEEQEVVESAVKTTVTADDAAPSASNKESDFANELVGTKYETYALEIINRGLAAMPVGKDRDEIIGPVVQALLDAKPKEPMEARLLLQAHALYAQGMKYLSRAESQDMIPQAEHFMKFAIKLLRLHNETIEALNKYRRKGEQRVVVQRVNVNDGGKAIVGHLESSNGGEG